MNQKLFLDINCDVGEAINNEENLFPHISSCNIACGGHAGNKKEMKKIVLLAQKFGLNIGAHPSYPDKENFGRKKYKFLKIAKRFYRKSNNAIGRNIG